MCNNTSLSEEKSIQVQTSDKKIDGMKKNAKSERSSGNHTDRNSSEGETSNEYVLNIAFFSFLLFMSCQAVFAIIAKSQSMLADSMAMSVDAFTYLFNLAAEKLKHRSYKNEENDDMPIEERKRKKKVLRLYLELVPPTISVIALVCVSAQTLMEAITTITAPPNLSADTEDEPNVNLMLAFSALNLALDAINVFFFSKVQNFSITGDVTVAGDVTIAGDEELGFVVDEENATNSHNRNESPRKTRTFPPSIIVDTSVDTSVDSSNSASENQALLGIPLPNYGSPKTDNEWSEDFSLDAVCGETASDGITSEGLSITSIETSDSNSAYSNSKSLIRPGPLSLGPDELDGISEGDEDSQSDNLSISQCSLSDGNDSETSGRGFNLNMCSAYSKFIVALRIRHILYYIASTGSV